MALPYARHDALPAVLAAECTTDNDVEMARLAPQA